jgi:hypothetical protein
VSSPGAPAAQWPGIGPEPGPTLCTPRVAGSSATVCSAPAKIWDCATVLSHRSVHDLVQVGLTTVIVPARHGGSGKRRGRVCGGQGRRLRCVSGGGLKPWRGDVWRPCSLPQPVLISRSINEFERCLGSLDGQTRRTRAVADPVGRSSIGFHHRIVVVNGGEGI